MRPVDALSRHASSWGWLVTVSAFALLTAGLVMAVWWAATDEERTATYQVRGSVTAITLDIGEADLQIVGGGSQAALQVSHTDRFSFNHPAEAERVVRGRRAAAALALPGRADRQLLLRLPAARARQRPGQGQDHERRRLLQRLPRLGHVDTTLGRRRLRRLVRLQPAGPRRRRRRPRRRVLRAAAPAAALARRLGAGARPARPLPRRRRERRGQAQRRAA